LIYWQTKVNDVGTSASDTTTTTTTAAAANKFRNSRSDVGNIEFDCNTSFRIEYK
jgi:hypothetical protein